MSKRKTREDYHSLAKKRDFVWIGEYPKNTKTKTLWQCRNNHTWMSKYNSIDQGRGCPHCAKRARKSKKDYLSVGIHRGIKWIGTFLPNGNKEKTLWKCLICDHKWGARYNDIYNGRGCPECGKENRIQLSRKKRARLSFNCKRKQLRMGRKIAQKF